MRGAFAFDRSRTFTALSCGEVTYIRPSLRAISRPSATPFSPTVAILPVRVLSLSISGTKEAVAQPVSASVGRL